MKLKFRITFETEVELTEEQREMWEFIGMSHEEVCESLNEDPEAHELLPRFDPEDYPRWQCVDSEWEGEDHV